MAEITSLRNENSKDYSIGGGKFQRVITGQPQHYKDDYKDAKEAWKDIDLTIVNGRVDKAPYIMVIDGNKVAVTDKKTGKASIVELLKVGDTTISKTDLSADSKSAEIIKDVDYDLVFTRTQIKFQRTIKTAEALKEATFKITGDIPVIYSAVDADGDAVQVNIMQDKEGNVVESFVAEKTLISTAGGKITESKVAPTYPIKIDPTLTISGTGKDTYISRYDPTTNYGSNSPIGLRTNAGSTYREHILVSMPFLDSLPSSAVISDSKFHIYFGADFTGSSVGQTITLYKNRRADWVEGEATWNIYKSGSNWGTAGCENTTSDIDTSITATQTQPAVGEWLIFDVDSIISDARTNSLDFNVRMSITDSSTDRLPLYRSKENTVGDEYDPKLVIEYTVSGLAKKHHYYQKMMG